MTKKTDFPWYQVPSKLLYKYVIKRVNDIFNSGTQPATKAVAVSSVRSVDVDDLIVKLWGGYAKYAAADLYSVASDTGSSSRDRSRAAWELMRYYLTCGELEKFPKVASVLKAKDKGLYRSVKTKLLRIEYHLCRKETDLAIELAKFMVENRSLQQAANFYLSMSNALGGNEVSGSSSQKLDGQRLGYYNTILLGHGLAPIRLINPERGLVFGNFTCDAPAFGGPDESLLNSELISVLVPVYNASRYLEFALDSLCKQTWSNLEIIVVDDASKDGSFDIAERLAAQDPRIKVFKNECNKGAYQTRNRALREAKGDLITVHDSDDWSHPEMLQLQALELLGNDSLKGTCSMMVRVTENMHYAIRPERRNLEYIHRSYPSLLLRREVLNELGCWDGVCANADDELFQRIRLKYGEDVLKDVIPSVPLSFFLKHSQSLTQSPDYHLTSLTFGVRREYAEQAMFWRTKQDASDLSIGGRLSMKSPFPIPSKLAPNDWAVDTHYELVIVSDLGLLGGTRRCNQGYIQTALDSGARVGLFHWPRYDLKYTNVSSVYRELSYHNNVDIIVHEDSISADFVLVHHPPILKYALDSLPTINAKNAAILVNQLPMQLRGQSPHYYDMTKSQEFLRSWLSVDKVVWLPISGMVKEALKEIDSSASVADSVWSPPYAGAVVDSRVSRNAVGDLPSSSIVSGRHSRDHWTKWPSESKDTADAYCAGREFQVELLGGAKYALGKGEKKPSNWTIHEFDSLSVDDYLSNLDFFVHFTHEDYIEEFGRNIMEAMARGIPVLLPEVFKDTFGDAAFYCRPDEVYESIIKLWNRADLYQQYSDLGRRFVLENCVLEVVKSRMSEYLLN